MRQILVSAILGCLCKAKVSDYADMWKQNPAIKLSGEGNVLIRKSFPHTGKMRGSIVEPGDISPNKVSLMRNPRTGFTIVSEQRGSLKKVSIGTDDKSEETIKSEKDNYGNDMVENPKFRKRLDAMIAKNKASAKKGRSRTTFEGTLADTTGAELDSNGTIVIDYFCAFTKGAARHVRNHLHMACEFGAEAVNSALFDSGITNVRLRVVGAELFNENEDLDDKWSSMSNPTFHEATRWVQPLGKRHGADLMTSYLLQDESKGTGIIGLGLVPGQFTMVTIDHIGAVEHEIGHNLGLSHCPDPQYPKGNTGYMVPGLGYGTMMCGSDIPVFSNANLKFQGHALGDSITDGVRYMKTTISTISRMAKSIYPLDEVVPHKKVVQTNTIILKKKGEMSKSFPLIITGGQKVIWITTNSDSLGDLYIRKDTAPTPKEYLYKTSQPVLAIYDAEPGVYYVSMRTIVDGAENYPREVNVWVPAKEGDEGDEGDEDKTSEGFIPAWDKDVAYSEPCTRVVFDGLVFANGWHTQGDMPDAADPWGVWRTLDSPDFHSNCK